MGPDFQSFLTDDPQQEASQVASLLAGLHAAQQRFCAEVEVLVDLQPTGSLISQMAALHLSLNARLFASQQSLLEAAVEMEREVEAIAAGAPTADGVTSDDWLEEVFPDLLARDLSTRLRLQSLSDALDPDPTALTDLTAVLDSDHVVRMSGCHENEAMNRLLDDLWCSTRALRRAVLDDAHARAVLSVRIAAMQREYVGEAPALEAPPAPDVEHPSALETIRATLRSAEAVPLRDVLTSLLAHLPDAPSGVDASLEPVTDEPLFRLDGDDWKFEVVAPMAAHEQRNFWDVETPLRRERRAWPNFRTPQVRVTS